MKDQILRDSCDKRLQSGLNGKSGPQLPSEFVTVFIIFMVIATAAVVKFLLIRHGHREHHAIFFVGSSENGAKQFTLRLAVANVIANWQNFAILPLTTHCANGNMNKITYGTAVHSFVDIDKSCSRKSA